MKKFISVVLALTTLISLTAIVFTVNVNAFYDNDMWTVLTQEYQYDEHYEGDRKSIPGYFYDEEGFHTYGGEWVADAPYHLVQTKEAVNIQNGVYLEVRVDAFDYAAGDKWFNFNIWSDANLVPGTNDTQWGVGVQTLLRPSAGNAETGAPGTVSTIEWWVQKHGDTGNKSPITQDNCTIVTVNGKQCLIFNLSITWDWDKETYDVSINGSSAPQSTIEYMNQTFADGNAFIGFGLYSSDKGGEQACTILKYGMSAEFAETPTGTDNKEPIIINNSAADIADPSTVPAGSPAVYMTGDIGGSHLKSKPESSAGAIISITEDRNIHVIATKFVADTGGWSVDKDISYSVKDFPILMCLTKNLCTCGMDSRAECLALETSKAYVLVGDIVAADRTHAYDDLTVCYDPYFIENDDGTIDNYLTYVLNFAETTEEGRFNGVRIDFQGIDYETPGKNAFDVCWIGLFRTEEEATKFAEQYLTNLGWIEPNIDDETENTVDTEETTLDTTLDTKAPTDEETIPSATSENDDMNSPAGGGCGSFVGFGTMIVATVSAFACMASFKRKKD